MSEDYFTRLDRQLAQLTLAGAHLDPAAHRWSAFEHAVRRTAAVVAMTIALAAMLVIEFPGSASGRVHEAAVHCAPVAVAATARHTADRDA